MSLLYWGDTRVIPVMAPRLDSNSSNSNSLLGHKNEIERDHTVSLVGLKSFVSHRDTGVQNGVGQNSIEKVQF